MAIAAQVNVKLWLERDGVVLLGAGRAELLRRVSELGSLKKAAESMRMSYRAAWGKIKRIEAALGIPVVESAGARRDGGQLTAQVRQLVDAFLLWQEEVSRYALERAANLPLLEARSVGARHASTEAAPDPAT